MHPCSREASGSNMGKKPNIGGTRSSSAYDLSPAGSEDHSVMRSFSAQTENKDELKPGVVPAPNLDIPAKFTVELKQKSRSGKLGSGFTGSNYFKKMKVSPAHSLNTSPQIQHQGHMPHAASMPAIYQQQQATRAEKTKKLDMDMKELDYEGLQGEKVSVGIRLLPEGQVRGLRHNNITWLHERLKDMGLDPLSIENAGVVEA